MTTKVLILRVSVGDDDTRDINTFIHDARSALEEYAEAKNVVVLGEEYIVDGQRVRPENYVPPNPEDVDDGTEGQDRESYTDTQDRESYVPDPKPEDEPWCNHDAPHLAPGDTCECGEVVPARDHAQTVQDIANKVSDNLSIRQERE